MLAYGKLDQGIHRAIESLQSQLRLLNYALGHDWVADKIDDRFDHRVKHVRRVLVALHMDKTALVVEFDNITHRLKPVTRSRAHFAHGSVMAIENQVVISDFRESNHYTTKFREAGESWDGKIPPMEIIGKLWKQHLDIRYTTTDLDELCKQIELLQSEIMNLTLQSDAVLRPRIDKALGR